MFFTAMMFLKVPSLEVTGEDELQLEFAFALRACLGIDTGLISLNVMAYHFLKDFVRAVDVLKLRVQDRIDPVFVFQRPEAILPAETRENGAVVESVWPSK